MKKNPWSYRVDYESEIAADEAMIACCERLLTEELSVPDDHPTVAKYGHILAVEWALSDERIASAVWGADARAVAASTAYWCEHIDIGIAVTDTAELCLSQRDTMRAHDVACAVLGGGDSIALTASDARKASTRARASLARHKRNARKHDGGSA